MPWPSALCSEKLIKVNVMCRNQLKAEEDSGRAKIANKNSCANQNYSRPRSVHVVAECRATDDRVDAKGRLQRSAAGQKGRPPNSGEKEKLVSRNAEVP